MISEEQKDQIHTKYSHQQESEEYKQEYNHSDSWLRENARPLCLLLLVLTYIGGIITGNFTDTYLHSYELVLSLAFGGYVIGRSAEKITSILSNKKQ